MKIKTLSSIRNNEFIEAVRAGDVARVEAMLRGGASVESIYYLPREKECRERAAHISSKQGHLDMMRLLDRYQVDWEAEGEDLMTPLFYAIISENMEAIRFLVEEKRVNIMHKEVMGRTPFYWSCASSRLDIIRYIYEQAGGQVGQSSLLGRTPLTKACFLGKVELVKFLISLPGISVHEKCKQGRTALHNAVFGPRGGKHSKKFGTFDRDSPECALLLIEAGANINEPDNDGQTPMHVAASSEAVDCLLLLLDKGVNTESRNRYGETPLHVSCKFGNIKYTQVLVGRGGDIRALDGKGHTPLQAAILNNQREVVLLLKDSLPQD